MKWISPIKDENKLQLYLEELGKMGQKYRIMVLIGIGTGLQLQEILRLKVREVRKKEYFSAVIGMRDIKREFRIPADIRKEIDSFTEGKDPEDYLIYGHETRMDHPLSREQAYRVMKEAGSRAGIKDAGAAAMRKTFAWRYYQRTGDIYYLQDLLNHVSPAVTYRYIGITPDVRVGVQKLPPDESARARARLFEGKSGVLHIERLRKDLLDIEKEMQSPKNPDAWFGKTESLLQSIDVLLDEYRGLR